VSQQEWRPAKPKSLRDHPTSVPHSKAATLAVRSAPAAPPVYRPNHQPKVLQRKLPPGQPVIEPSARPVYCPQPTPKVLHSKIHCRQSTGDGTVAPAIPEARTGPWRTTVQRNLNRAKEAGPPRRIVPPRASHPVCGKILQPKRAGAIQTDKTATAPLRGAQGRAGRIATAPVSPRQWKSIQRMETTTTPMETSQSTDLLIQDHRIVQMDDSLKGSVAKEMEQWVQYCDSNSESVTSRFKELKDVKWAPNYYSNPDVKQKEEYKRAKQRNSDLSGARGEATNIKSGLTSGNKSYLLAYSRNELQGVLEFRDGLSSVYVSNIVVNPKNIVSENPVRNTLKALLQAVARINQTHKPIKLYPLSTRVKKIYDHWGFLMTDSSTGEAMQRPTLARDDHRWAKSKDRSQEYQNWKSLNGNMTMSKESQLEFVKQ
jgi:hypothetical protein